VLATGCGFLPRAGSRSTCRGSIRSTAPMAPWAASSSSWYGCGWPMLPCCSAPTSTPSCERHGRRYLRKL